MAARTPKTPAGPEAQSTYAQPILALAALTLMVPMGPMAVLLIPAVTEAVRDAGSVLEPLFTARSRPSAPKTRDTSMARGVLKALGVGLKAAGKLIVMFTELANGAAPHDRPITRPAQAFPCAAARRPAQVFRSVAANEVYASPASAAPPVATTVLGNDLQATPDVVATAPEAAPIVGVVAGPNQGAANAANEDTYTLAA